MYHHLFRLYVPDHPRLPSGVLHPQAHLPMLANVLGIYLLTAKATESLAGVCVLLQGARGATLLIDNPELIASKCAYFLCHTNISLLNSLITSINAVGE